MTCFPNPSWERNVLVSAENLEAAGSPFTGPDVAMVGQLVFSAQEFARVLERVEIAAQIPALHE